MWLELLVVFAFIAVLSGLGYYVYVTEYKQGQKGYWFMQQAEEAMGYQPPKEEMQKYDEVRDELLNQAWADLQAKGGAAASSKPGDEEDLDKMLMRTLEGENKKKLMGFLMRRTFANIPRWERLQKDVPGKMQLYRRGLITEEHWNFVDKAQQELVEELKFLKAEADAIEAGFGEKLFPQAWQLYRQQQQQHQQMMQQHHMMMMQQMRAKQAEDAKKNAELDEQKKAQQAEKNAQLLMKEEEEKEKRAAAKRAAAKAQTKK